MARRLRRGGRTGGISASWPYVVVLFREREQVEDRGRLVTPELAPILVSRRVSTAYERAIYVEGDITVETWDSHEERQAATAETAAFYLSLRGPEYDGVHELAGWKEGDPVPERLRLPYRSRPAKEAPTRP
jgi:hypothetical protein